jgi:hypothetical protein
MCIKPLHSGTLAPRECGSLGCGDIPYNETSLKSPEMFLDSFSTYSGKGRVQRSDSAYILHIQTWLRWGY